MDKIDGFLSAKINGKSEEKAENEVKVTRRRTAQRKTAARKSPLKNEKRPQRKGRRESSPRQR